MYRLIKSIPFSKSSPSNTWRGLWEINVHTHKKKEWHWNNTIPVFITVLGFLSTPILRNISETKSMPRALYGLTFLFAWAHTSVPKMSSIFLNKIILNKKFALTESNNKVFLNIILCILPIEQRPPPPRPMVSKSMVSAFLLLFLEELVTYF
jgi:hypothetical protein